MKRKITIIAFMVAALVGWSQDFSAVCSTGQTLYYTVTSSTAFVRSVPVLPFTQ